METSIPSQQEKPETYTLQNNYPNPFNPQTRIKFSLPTSEFVRLQVYNTLGQQVRTLVNKPMEAGSHSVTFNAGSLPSGVYIYRIQTEKFTRSRKMLLVK
jgi:hypothetical protein